MAAKSKTNTIEARPGSAEWLLFAIIVAAGGSAFALIRGAIESVPPAVVTVARLWIGALFLLAVMAQAGRRLPRFWSPAGDKLPVSKEWQWMIAIGAIGYAFPFFVFPWAQQKVDSGLAGIYMAFMPLWTILLAHFFADETLGTGKIIGVALGVLGVGILMGPGAIGAAGSADFAAQAGLLGATLAYAAAAVATRLAPEIRPRPFAAGCQLSAAIVATPALIITDPAVNEWTLSGVLCVLGLGLIPTGLGGFLLIIIIQRVGAGFMSFANYLVPVFAVVLGALVFGETLPREAFIAMAVIIAGVAVSQWPGRQIKQPAP
ncbi:MAG: DMT family transporter [Pseudomonadota bacterium]